MSNNDSEYMPTDPLFSAHKLAFLAAGRDAADAILTKHGGKGGAGGWRRVPQSQRKAAIADLERLAASTPPNARTEAGVEQVRRTAFGSGERWDEMRRNAFDNAGTAEQDKPKIPKSFAELAEQAYRMWNRKLEKPTE
jgi:hypothetical protein